MGAATLLQKTLDGLLDVFNLPMARITRWRQGSKQVFFFLLYKLVISVFLANPRKKFIHKPFDLICRNSFPGKDIIQWQVAPQHFIPYVSLSEKCNHAPTRGSTACVETRTSRFRVYIFPRMHALASLSTREKKTKTGRQTFFVLLYAETARRITGQLTRKAAREYLNPLGLLLYSACPPQRQPSNNCKRWRKSMQSKINELFEVRYFR